MVAVQRAADANDTFVKECVERRRTRYAGVPRNVHRHVVIADIKDAATSLPRVSLLIVSSHAFICAIFAIVLRPINWPCRKFVTSAFILGAEKQSITH